MTVSLGSRRFDLDSFTYVTPADRRRSFTAGRPVALRTMRFNHRPAGACLRVGNRTWGVYLSWHRTHLDTRAPVG